jgi:hypothetical protein
MPSGRPRLMAVSTTALTVGAMLAAGGLASADRAPQTPSPARHAAAVGQVTGKVVNGKGEPVEGALVNVVRPNEVVERGIIAAETPRRDWTDANG